MPAPSPRSRSLLMTRSQKATCWWCSSPRDCLEICLKIWGQKPGRVLEEEVEDHEERQHGDRGGDPPPVPREAESPRRHRDGGQRECPKNRLWPCRAVAEPTVGESVGYRRGHRVRRGRGRADRRLVAVGCCRSDGGGGGGLAGVAIVLWRGPGARRGRWHLLQAC